MITAIARVALLAGNHPEPHKRSLTEFEHASIEGTGDTWEAARDACVIPDGAVVMHWRRAN